MKATSLVLCKQNIGKNALTDNGLNIVTERENDYSYIMFW